MKRDDDDDEDDDSEPRKKKKKKGKKGKGKKAKKPHYDVSPEAFVDAWSASATVDEVMTRTGLPRNAVYSRVNSYRKKGVKLKRMSRPPRRMNIDALNAIVDRNTAAKQQHVKK